MNDILVPESIKNIIRKKSSDYFSSVYDSRTIMEDYKKMDDFRHGTSWHIPSQDLVDSIIKYGPILSVGSGFGYTESLAKSQGADIIASDINPDISNKWCRDGKYHCEVEKLTAVEAIQKYPDRNIFMAWPPYDHPMAHEVVKEMSVGNYLIYVGEGRGGCTGDDEFFDKLYKDFEEIGVIDMISWRGIYDNCVVYKKLR